MPEEIKRTPVETALLKHLHEVRAKQDVTLPPSPILRREIVGLDGQLHPFTFRYYQVQGIYHMLRLKRMVLGDGTGLGKCTVVTTRICTSLGYRELGELKPKAASDEGFYDLDQPVSVWTGERMASIRRFYWGGRKPTLKITTRNGYTLEGSRVHPIYVRRRDGEQFQKTPDLRVGDFVCLDRSAVHFPVVEPKLPSLQLVRPGRAFTFPNRLTPDLAALLGWQIAEGNRHPSSVIVTQHSSVNPECHAEIRRLFLEVFGWSGNAGSRNQAQAVIVPSQDIRRFLIACGVAEVLSKDKTIPPCIFSGTRESVRAFLSAYFEAEGSVCTDSGGVEVSSASETLLEQVQLLLLRFGIVCTRTPKTVKGHDHVYWRLTFFGEDAKTFQREIGFFSSRKREALASKQPKTSNPNKDVIPYAAKLISDLKSEILAAVTRLGANQNRKGSGIKQFGESFQSTLKHIIHEHRDPTYQWLRHLLTVAHDLGLESCPAYLAVQQVERRRFYYDPIVNIEDGEAEVADLEVDDPGHCFFGNGFINHNTVETIGTLCYIWAKFPNTKVIVVAPKSAIRQWSEEIARFTIGIDVHIATAPKQKGETPLEARKRIYKVWSDSPGKSVLILNYALLVRDWNQDGFQPLKPNGKPDPKAPVLPGVLDAFTKQAAENLVVIFDEATAFKSMRTKTWEIARFLSDRANRVYGLTATLLKNNLMEGYCIYKAILPGLFGPKTKFLENYCFYELKEVARGAKIPVIKGYKNLDHFKDTIDLNYLGRPKHAVSKELPTLTTREVVCELSPAEASKYREALTGVLELGDGEIREFEETKALTSLIYCQQVVDSLAMLKFREGDVLAGPAYELSDHRIGTLFGKEQALLDLLEEELDGEKVIVYTRFESLVGRLVEILKKNGIKSVRITGKEKDVQRAAAQKAFQDLKSDVRVVFITNAGSEAINLQAAAGMVFYDMPWSWGDYVQILGRMIRIGSPHKGVLTFHLLAELPETGKDRKTIDHHVLGMLRKKKGLIDKVLGEAAVGALKFETSGASLKDLIRSMQKAA
jgi:intein/homing endonuclease